MPQTHVGLWYVLQSTGLALIIEPRGVNLALEMQFVLMCMLLVY